MSNLVALNAGPRAPADLPEKLRALADAVERGECTAAVAASVKGGSFEFIYGASIRDSLELATILQARCIERYRE